MKNQFTRLIWVCCTYTLIILSSNQIYGQCVAYVGCAADVNSAQYATVIADDPFCCDTYWDGLCQTEYSNLGGPINPVSTCSATCVTDVACADNSSLEYDEVILADPFCCNTEWDQTCQNAYDQLFGPTNPACFDCVDPGCDADVSSFEYDQVISSDPFCCNIGWDSECAAEYAALGGQPSTTPSCLGVCISYVGCSADVNSAQYATVIADDPFCCDTFWDGLCQNAYDALSGPPNPDPICTANCVTEVACADNTSLEYDEVILADDFCCNTEWDDICQDAYDQLFGPTNPECEDCVSPGCAADPTSFEYDLTIISDPFCCQTEWDNLCQNEYILLGGQPNPNPVCTADCVTEVFCADITSLQYEEVILADSFCCNTEWDDICQEAYDLLDGPTNPDCQNCIDPGCDVDINSFEYDQVITDDPFCCETDWDSACETAYADLNGQPSTDPDCCTADPGCSADINSPEYAIVIADDPFCCYDTWDGICQQAYAFLGGQLNPSPGCECSADPGCDADVNSAEYVIVVGADPFCCNGAWDSTCQDAYDNLGGLPNQSPDPSCCNIDPGCDADITSSEYAAVVAADPFCCYTEWDELCQTAYDDLGGPPSSEPGCGAALSGSVNWNINCGDRATTVRFYTPGTSTLIATYNTTLAADGSFNIPAVDAGTYDVFVKVSGHLVKGFGSVTISSGGNVLAVGNVIPGDINNADGINIDDLTILLNAFGSTMGDPDFNPLADLNCDGDVNIDDLTLLITNFGQSGDSPPLN